MALSACSIAVNADEDASVDAAQTGCDGSYRSHCVQQVSLGAHFGCATLGDRSVWCWGRNDEAQLGCATTQLCPEQLPTGMSRSVSCQMYPLQVSGLPAATVVSAGGAHACALLATREVRCWGSNASGQLGNGAVLPSATPVTVDGVMHATAIAVGARHSCALSEGAVSCWGANDHGQLGSTTTALCMTADGMIACGRTRQPVATLTDVAEIVAGDVHTCARTRAGRVWCWGANGDGELGMGTASDISVTSPQAVRLGSGLLTGIQALAAGGHHTCALRDDGGLFCWGRNDRGQLGIPVLPAPFEPCVNACSRLAVVAGGFAGTRPSSEADAGMIADASSSDGAARDATALTDVSRTDVNRTDANRADAGARDETPPVAATPVVTSLATGSDFSCARLDDATLRCWGANRAGQVGSGQMSEGGPTPVMVIASPGAAATNPLQNAVTIEAGGGTACALSGDRSLRCWGSNEDGALGEGTSAQHSGPVPVTW